MHPELLKIRTFGRNSLLNFLSRYSEPKPGIHILNSHFLSLDGKASPEIFEELLSGMEDRGVRFISFEEAVKRITAYNLPVDECLVAFSWDDGFEECFTRIKPVLDRRSLKTAFFINPGFIDGDEAYRYHFTHEVVMVDKPPMSWEQLRILSSEGHVVGAHTLDHLSLDSDNTELLHRQIAGSKIRIEDKINARIEHFAFPFGRLKLLSPLGLQLALSNFKYVYSQSNYRHYFSFDGKVINRRHFECDWPLEHVIYFLKSKKF